MHELGTTARMKAANIASIQLKVSLRNQYKSLVDRKVFVIITGFSALQLADVLTSDLRLKPACQSLRPKSALCQYEQI